MSQIPPLLRDQRKVDADHLKLLSIFHFVGAGLATLGVFFLLVHYTIFFSVLFNPKRWEDQKQTLAFVEFLANFKWFYLVFGIWFVGSGILSLLSGLFIRSRKHRAFSLIVAGVNCAHMPLGTLLGVFTIIVLIRDSVRELYEA